MKQEKMTTKIAKYGIMIIAAVLLIAMAFAGVAASAVPTSVEPSGTGTDVDPYLINVSGHLTWMADNAGISSGKIFKFDCSTGLIDCGGATLNIIGNDTNKFSGIIEGNYTAISNFSISGSSNIGLFGSYTGT
ncbi:MAG TPA: hypothetical protein O0X27_05765, partial [Methanocorpusculum sp.]|nr:hypothetical protein [Methanocorpusculum sp.]